MPQTCHACGILPADGQFFEDVPTSFSGKKRFCPNCSARRARKTSERFLFAYLSVGIAGLAVYLGVPEWRGLGIFLLNLFFLQMFVLLATIPHELGHAFVGRFFGFEVTRVIVGFGTPLWHGRILGFPFEFRRVPYGGLTVAQLSHQSWFRTRWFLMILAGPLVNAIMAGVFYFAADRSISIRLSGTLNPIGLFVFANAIVFFENLLPYKTTSARGNFLSDGYQLVRLLFPRAFEQPAQSQPTPTRRVFRRLFKTFVISFFALCTVVSLGIGALLIASGMWQQSPGGLIVMELLFLVVAAILVWAIWRVARTPLDEPERRQSAGTETFTHDLSGNEALSPYAPLMKEYAADFARFNEWPEPQVSPPLLTREIGTLLQKKDFAGAERALHPYLAKAPQNLWMHVVHGTALCGQKRFAEAAAVFERTSSWPDLSFGSKSLLQAEMLRCLVLANRSEEAAPRCEELLANTDSIIAKAHTLDMLASISHAEERPDYLAEADKWSRRALEIAPDFITLKGTRGAVLADLRRFDEAKPLLQEVYDTSESDIDKGIALFYLALCAKADGDLAKATKFARRASVIHPQPWLLKRMKQEQLG